MNQAGNWKIGAQPKLCENVQIFQEQAYGAIEQNWVCDFSKLTQNLTNSRLT